MRNLAGVRFLLRFPQLDLRFLSYDWRRLCGEVHFGYHAGAVSAQKYEGRIPKDELGSSACRGGMQDC